MTKKFATELSQYGLTIISGMAEGIDGIAHSATLEVYGKTIAVLPCGFKNIFPENNIKLYILVFLNIQLLYLHLYYQTLFLYVISFFHSS